MPSESLLALAERFSVDVEQAASKALARSSLPNPYFGAVDEDMRSIAVQMRRRLLASPAAPGRFGFLVSKDGGGGLVASWTFRVESAGCIVEKAVEGRTLNLPDASSFIFPISEEEFEDRAESSRLHALNEENAISILDFSKEVFKGKPKNPSRGGGAGLNLTFGHWMKFLLEAPDHPLPACLEDARLAGAVQPVFYTELWCGGGLAHLTLKDDSSICPITAVKPAADYLLRSCRVDEDPRRTHDYWKNLSPVIVEASTGWVVAEKPSGMLSVPGTGGLADCKSRLEEMLGDAPGSLAAVHRLDMDTSGLIVYARTEDATKSLMKQFREKEVDKTYRARLRGTLKSKDGAVDLPITTHPADRLRQIIAHGGRPSRTLYKTLDVFSMDSEVFSDVELTPVTGRTHQLRIHSAHMLGLNRPILGDPYYGPEGIQAEAPGSRLHLHARSLSFTDPDTGLRASFESVPRGWIGG